MYLNYTIKNCKNIIKLILRIYIYVQLNYPNSIWRPQNFSSTVSFTRKIFSSSRGDNSRSDLSPAFVFSQISSTRPVCGGLKAGRFCSKKGLVSMFPFSPRGIWRIRPCSWALVLRSACLRIWFSGSTARKEISQTPK